MQKEVPVQLPISAIIILVFWTIIATPSGVIQFPVFSSFAIIITFYLCYILKAIPKRYFSIIQLLRYGIWILKEIILSSIDITKVIWGREIKVESRNFEVVTEFKQNDPLLIIYANSITLTPGTYTINTEGSRLKLNALSANTMRDIKSRRMERKIQEIFASDTTNS